FPENLDGQFLMGSPAEEISDRLLAQGAKPKNVSGLSFLAFDPLKIVAVRDANGQEIGALLGTPIDRHQGLIDDEYTIDAPLTPDVDAFVETYIYSLTGSFIFVLATGEAQRVYLDACGSLSLVYDPVRRCVASTSTLLLHGDELEARFDSALYDHLRVERDGWFTAGLTAHSGIKRLLPNFYLDLSDFTTARHWPMRPIEPASDPIDACRVLLDTTRITTRHLVAGASASVALTAGNETRMILAACKDFARDLCFVTVDADTTSSDIDIVHSSSIAKKFHLNHELIQIAMADEAAADEWRSRSGYCFGGPHIYTHPTVAALKSRRFFVGGLGGEIGRAFLWRPGDAPSTKLDAEGITARLGMPISDKVVDAVRDWLDNTQGFDALTTLDLAYLELRMGCWGFASAYGDYSPIDIHPLISRSSFTAMMSLPADWRIMHERTNKMIVETVRLGWPEILEFPINRYGDHRDRFSRLRRVVAQPHLAIKRLRKRFG
ncbi:MAG: hypothetical protein NXI02_17690, partial [Rhodobacteraceae bacterium]|nr:hypothetical protein [Paracoccaceae bacterium]